MLELTPKQIVEELDKYIVGQDAAKRAAAVAIRNRWRRRQLPDDLRDEVMSSLFGRHAKSMRKRALGIDVRSVTTEHRRRSISHENNTLKNLLPMRLGRRIASASMG